MHWGRGEIVEEASFQGEHHEPVIQLMEYNEGEAAGSLGIRFCSYGQRGNFMRMPLMLSEEDLEGIRVALKKTPRLLAVLRRLVD
jgi:hypothetical protein